MIYLITGRSGSGKTTVGEELRLRGFRVIDADQEFVAGLIPGESPWVWDAAKVARALNDCESSDLFVCGGADNESEFWPLFDSIFVLKACYTVLAQRLFQRGSPPEWAWHLKEFACRSIMIDAEQTALEVADDILASVRITSHT